MLGDIFDLCGFWLKLNEALVSFCESGRRDVSGGSIRYAVYVVSKVEDGDGYCRNW